MAARARFSAGDALARVGFAVALVLVTYNPTAWSYVRWALGHASEQAPYIALAGAVLLILWVIYLRSTFRALGVIGIALAGAFLAALLWVLSDMGLLALDSGDAAQWAALISVGVVLGIGLSWSHIRRALSGQADVDDVDD